MLVMVFTKCQNIRLEVGAGAITRTFGRRWEGDNSSPSMTSIGRSENDKSGKNILERYYSNATHFRYRRSSTFAKPKSITACQFRCQVLYCDNIPYIWRHSVIRHSVCYCLNVGTIGVDLVWDDLIQTNVGLTGCVVCVSECLRYQNNKVLLLLWTVLVQYVNYQCPRYLRCIGS